MRPFFSPKPRPHTNATIQVDPTSCQASVKAGSGLLELTRVGQRTVATRAMATNPLKLMIPRRRGPAAWIYTSTFGGGLVSGDQIDMNVRLGPDATGVLTTQASTKIYRNYNGRASRQSLSAVVAPGATLVITPDPITCFADALFEQKQRFDLESGANLVLLDWQTCGRRARGERWAFQRFHSKTDIYYNNDLILVDSLLLDAEDGPLTGPFRLGRFNCLAMVVLIGEKLATACHDLLQTIYEQPVDPGASVVDTASPIKHGAIWRILGENPEQVFQSLKSRLRFLQEIVGESPWSRKW